MPSYLCDRFVENLGKLLPHMIEALRHVVEALRQRTSDPDPLSDPRPPTPVVRLQAAREAPE
jgi:hypothetical protein